MKFTFNINNPEDVIEILKEIVTRDTIIIVLYINLSFYFNNKKVKSFLRQLNIKLDFSFFTFYKSIEIVKTFNYLLKNILRKSIIEINKISALNYI